MSDKILIPEGASFIIEKLKENNYEGFIVGGCVRDALLGMEPHDYDITTNAKPEVVNQLFEKTIPTGLQHGTVTVIKNKEQYEVTTYREDGTYSDGRHPDAVKFVSDIKFDLSRRDFTINAMAYNKERGIVDFFEGRKDLNRKIIRTVGSPKNRFNEDALRMLRAVRFSVKLGFEIEEETFKSIKELAPNLQKVSKERIREEWNKIILKNPKGIKILKESGLLNFIIPELEKSDDIKISKNEEMKSLLEYVMSAASYIKEPDIALKSALLFQKLDYLNKTENNSEISLNDIKYKVSESSDKVSADMAEKILKALKYDNKTISETINLIQYQNADISDRKNIKYILNKIGTELFEKLIEFKYAAYITGCNKDSETSKRIESLQNSVKIYKDIIKNNECYTIKELNINGKDLMDKFNIKGKEVGNILSLLLEAVISDNNCNDKEKLLKIAEQTLNN